MEDEVKELNMVDRRNDTSGSSRVPGELLIQPGIGLPQIQLGQKVEEVIERIGKPDKIVGKFPDAYFLIYRSQGIDLDFGKRGGKLKAIFFYREGVESHKGSKAKTDKGIRLGDTRSKVLKIYGEPAYKSGPSILIDGYYSRECFYYEDGIQFRFGKDNRVDDISISKPKKKFLVNRVK
jgi:hypothetical protein